MKTPIHVLEKIKQNRAQHKPILDLRNQSLLSIPAEIRSLDHLEQLWLNNNAIQVLPTWLNELPQLRFIELNINPLRQLNGVTNLVLDQGVWQRLQPAPEQVAGLWIRWEDDIIIKRLKQLPKLRWLDLSQQRLREIPRVVFELKTLSHLGLSQNKLSSLPPEIAQLQNLSTLDIGANGLVSLPPEIAQLQNLSTLNIWHNQLVSLPPEIAQLQNLSTLDIGHNQLVSLPPEIAQLQNLSTLNIWDNQLVSLPPEIAQLQNLSTLDIGHNQLVSLPPEIAQLQNLSTLNIGYNALVSLPPEIAQLQNLSTLDIGYNALVSLPPEIAQLQNLSTLNIGYNALVSLPPEIAQLQNLSTLDISLNSLGSLPPEIAQLQNLSTLDIGYNSLVSLPPEIAQLQNLSTLEIGANGLVSLPPEIAQLQNLSTLNIGHNQLVSLPPEIAQLQNLSTLNIGHNQLVSLPPEIAQLQNLSTLNIGHNQLVSLPPEIAQLQNLSRLNIGHNQLVSLPPEIAQLQNLSTLDIGANALVSLPPEIAQLQNLSTLNIGYNALVSLPPEIAQLQNLSTLDIGHNQLVSLPPEIAQLEDLKVLVLNDNPLTTPPLERLGIEKYNGQADITRLRRYFRQITNSAEFSTKLYEAKLLLVGEGGAGKTSLARRLLDPKAVLPKKDESTRGIDIIDWRFKREDGTEFKVNIWDFGGQQIYHATHQFFLTKRSLYALVVDTRPENVNYYDWLNRIELFGGDSPVLIVKNQTDQRQVQLDEGTLKERFGKLKDSFDCNIKSNEGREKLVLAIRHRLQELDHIGDPFPKTWLAVREVLEADPRNTTSREEYVELCLQKGVKDRQEAFDLSDYLHDLGVFLHFQDDEVLKNRLILKPTWATDAVYKVLEDKKIISANGLFSQTDLQRIWHKDSHTDMRDELLRLMINFGLCYALPQGDEYIAPQLLSHKKPLYDWNGDNNLQLRYRYPGFMPDGLLARFSVAIHQMIEAERQRVWRHGVVVSDQHARAEIREDREHREICIRLSGEQRRDLLVTLVYELEKIHSKLHDLKYQQLVPCNCDQCVTQDVPHFHLYKNLKKFQADKLPEVQCNESGKMVSVSSLLDDISDGELEKVIRAEPITSSRSKPETVPDTVVQTSAWYRQWWATCVSGGLVGGALAWYWSGQFDLGLTAGIFIMVTLFLFSPKRRFFRLGSTLLIALVGSQFLPHLVTQWVSENSVWTKIARVLIDSSAKENTGVYLVTVLATSVLAALLLVLDHKQGN